MMIDRRQIGGNAPTYIIGEMGVNHDGDVRQAVRLVEAAARAGVDAIKIQLVDVQKDYAKDSASYEIFQSRSLTMNEWRQVAACARDHGVAMFASFAHEDMMAVSRDLGFPVLKVSSGNLTNYPLLRAMAESGLPIIMSTGMSFLEEVVSSVQYLTAHGASQIAVLHCTSLYPTPPSSVHLRAMETMRSALPEHVIGLSDHTLGIHASVAAVALGAKVLEKHFTLDPTRPGPEHHFSVSIEELSRLVSSVRDVELAMGERVKRPAPDEIPLRAALRRTLVASRDISAGEPLCADDLIAKRTTSKGLGAEMIDDVIGKITRRDLVQGESLTAEAL